jgi:hypothetical protein
LYLHEADSVNGRGEIVGIGLLPNGYSYIFLLEPEEAFVSEAELYGAAVIRRAENAATAATLKTQTPLNRDLFKGVHTRAARRFGSFDTTRPN